MNYNYLYMLIDLLFQSRRHAPTHPRAPPPLPQQDRGGQGCKRANPQIYLQVKQMITNGFFDLVRFAASRDANVSIYKLIYLQVKLIGNPQVKLTGYPLIFAYNRVNLQTNQLATLITARSCSLVSSSSTFMPLAGRRRRTVDMVWCVLLLQVTGLIYRCGHGLIYNIMTVLIVDKTSNRFRHYRCRKC